ncbi:MAG: efflux RND transporter periplasmic adaptor subunit [Thermoanaerobaculia bacterium]
MKKTWIWAALVVAIGVGAFLLLGSRKKAGPKYRTAVVDQGDVTQTVTATGTLSAVTTVKVGSVVSGIVAALHADFNKQVKKGDLLAELDPVPFQARVAQTQAALEKARVEVRNAEIGLRRQKALEAEGLAPQADLDQAQADFDSATASVNQAQATLEQAQTDLRNSRIEAPIDGVVVDRQYDVGQSVAASFTAPTLFTIAQDLTKMQVSADVSESDIGQCKGGQAVRFTVDAYPDQIFRGTISQIRLNATVNQNVVTYPVIIEVPNPDLALRPNMTANVTIDVATVEDVLRVPNSALRFRPEEKEEAASPEERAARTARDSGPGAAARQLDRMGGAARPNRGGQRIYRIAASGLREPRPVEIRTGISDGRFTQVVSGEVQAGETVVVGLVTAKAESGPGMGSGRGSPGGGRRF